MWLGLSGCGDICSARCAMGEGRTAELHTQAAEESTEKCSREHNENADVSTCLAFLDIRGQACYKLASEKAEKTIYYSEGGTGNGAGPLEETHARETL